LFFELKIIGKTEILEIHSLFFSFYACWRIKIRLSLLLESEKEDNCVK
jgi:hypothetical protein